MQGQPPYLLNYCFSPKINLTWSWWEWYGAFCKARSLLLVSKVIKKKIVPMWIATWFIIFYLKITDYIAIHKYRHSPKNIPLLPLMECEILPFQSISSGSLIIVKYKQETKREMKIQVSFLKLSLEDNLKNLYHNM